MNDQERLMLAGEMQHNLIGCGDMLSQTLGVAVALCDEGIYLSEEMRGEMRALILNWHEMKAIVLSND